VCCQLSPADLTNADGMDVLIKRASEFHGHLGPFLVLGLRMGLAGLRELNLKGGVRKLRVIAKLPYSIPYSCTVDGLQIATKCTVGNKRLNIVDIFGIEAKFKLESGEHITVIVNSDFFNMLKGKLPSESVPNEKVRKLAQLVAYTSEDELFTIVRG
jgi:formylmethanofuran dehydrogenase subunit E